MLWLLTLPMQLLTLHMRTSAAGCRAGFWMFFMFFAVHCGYCIWAAIGKDCKCAWKIM